jgi:hypothetical protein
MSAEALALDDTHCCVICEEIGYRLRQVLKPESLEIPQRLLALLDRLSELDEAPSIVPSIDERSFRQRLDRSRNADYAVNRSDRARHQSQINFCRLLI